MTSQMRANVLPSKQSEGKTNGYGTTNDSTATSERAVLVYGVLEVEEKWRPTKDKPLDSSE